MKQGRIPFLRASGLIVTGLGAYSSLVKGPRKGEGEPEGGMIAPPGNLLFARHCSKFLPGLAHLLLTESQE